MTEGVACVTVLNVNYGRNAKLMEACEPLRGYSWFVDAIRRHNKACEDLDEAVDRALVEMPDDYLIKGFPVRNVVEVRGMVISGRCDQLFMARYAEENIRKGEILGEDKAQHDIAINLLRSGIPVQTVATCCGLSEDEVRSMEEGVLARV